MQKVALVGCGFMGKMHGNVYGILPNARLVVAVDKDVDRRDAFASQFGCAGFSTLQEALDSEEIDVVDVCLPTDLHAQFVIEAAKAGKNVFCEKPMARTAAQAEDMTRVCKENGVRLMIGHCIRFWPEY